MHKFPSVFQVMRTGTNQRPLTPGQGQQSQQESLAAAAAANPALAYTGMPGWCNSHIASSQTIYVLYLIKSFIYMFYDIIHVFFLNTYSSPPQVIRCWPLLPIMTRLELWLWAQVRGQV